MLEHTIVDEIEVSSQVVKSTCRSREICMSFSQAVRLCGCEYLYCDKFAKAPDASRAQPTTPALALSLLLSGTMNRPMRVLWRNVWIVMAIGCVWLTYHIISGSLHRFKVGLQPETSHRISMLAPLVKRNHDNFPATDTGFLVRWSLHVSSSIVSLTSDSSEHIGGTALAVRK